MLPILHEGNMVPLGSIGTGQVLAGGAAAPLNDDENDLVVVEDEWALLRAQLTSMKGQETQGRETQERDEALYRSGLHSQEVQSRLFIQAVAAFRELDLKAKDASFQQTEGRRRSLVQLEEADQRLKMLQQWILPIRKMAQSASLEETSKQEQAAVGSVSLQADPLPSVGAADSQQLQKEAPSAGTARPAKRRARRGKAANKAASPVEPLSSVGTAAGNPLVSHPAQADFLKLSPRPVAQQPEKLPAVARLLNAFDSLITWT